MKTTAEKKVNGVNVEKLHEGIRAVKETPAMGASEFRVRNRWMGGDRNITTVGGFKVFGEEHQHKTTFLFENGEPEALCGSDRGANPVEFLLHALAGCVTTATVMHAAANGITIHGIETEISGELDLQGLFGLDPNVRPGYEKIRLTMKIDSDAQGEALEKLKNFHKFSPVLNSIAKPVNVDVEIQI